MINPWLKRPEEIFKKIGYQIVNGNCFQLQNEPNSAFLVEIGTQCLFASAECSLLSEACRLADSTNYMPTLVLHLDHGGTSKDIVAKLRTTNERMFIDPDKDLFISDLPLDYGRTDLRLNSHSKPHPKGFQNYGLTYSAGHHLAAVSDFYLTQRTYTEEQQAALDSYRRPLTQKQTPLKPDLFRGKSVASSFQAAHPIPAAENSNCDRDSAYGDSTYEDSLHGSTSDGQPAHFNILSHTLRRPREPTEHSLEKPAEDEHISSPGRTLTPTHLSESLYERDTESRLAATFSSVPLSSSLTGWMCKICNYTNLTDNSVCKICSQIRSGNTPSPPSQPLQHRNSERTCEKCTLKNKVTARKCTACGQTFKGYHTAV